MSQVSHVRTYDRSGSIVFLKTNERFGGLSNMAPGFPLRVNGVRIRTSEALYQACRFPHMPEVQQLIISENSPMTAKMRSKPYRRVSRHDWDFVRVKIMRWCLRVKLAQNWGEFGGLLLATGDRPIVEQSRKDDFWGAKVTDEVTLVGMNVLGRLLMELREQLRSDESGSLRFIEPLAISEFLLFGRPIEAVQTARNVEISGCPTQRPSETEETKDRSGAQLSLFGQSNFSNATSHRVVGESNSLPPAGDTYFELATGKIEGLLDAFREALLDLGYEESDGADILFAKILTDSISKNAPYNDAIQGSKKQAALAEFERSLAQTFVELKSYHGDIVEKLEGNPAAKRALYEKSFSEVYCDRGG